MTGSNFTVPAEVLDAMLEGKSCIAAWREYRGLTQDRLAEDAGMLQPALAHIEAAKGKPRHSTLEKLAKALNVPEWALELAD